MIQSSNIFVFLQPELHSDRQGHFYQYIQALSQSLSQKGLKSILIGSEDFKCKDVEKVQINFKRRNFNVTRKYLMLRDIFFGNIMAVKDFVEIMDSVIANQPRSIFFIDTILNNRLVGLALAIKRISRKNPDSRFVAVFRFTYRSNSIIYSWLQKKLHLFFFLIVRKEIKNRKCFLLTDSELLKNLYDQNLSDSTLLFPIPISQEKFRTIRSQRLYKRLLCVGFIGGLGSYKGLDKYLRVITNLNEIQINYLVHGMTSKESLLEYACGILCKKEISKMNSILENLFIYGVLSENEYLDMFSKIDIILIPYSSPQFVEGTSNIFTECVSAGIVPVVPLNTWMAYELQKEGLTDFVVDFEKHALVAERVFDLIMNIDESRNKMESFVQKWTKYHSSDTFTNSLLLTLNI